MNECVCVCVCVGKWLQFSTRSPGMVSLKICNLQTFPGEGGERRTSALKKQDES